MFSSPTSRWTAGAAAAGLGLVTVAYVAVIAPVRGHAGDIADAAAAARQQNDALQIRIAQLKAEFATLPQRQAELSSMLGQIPVTADVPHFVRSLDALASDAGVSLDTVTPATPQILGAQGAAAGAMTGTAGAANGGAGAADQVVAVPMTVTVHGPYFKAVTFLKRLQSGQRAFLVTGLQVAVADTDVTLTVRGRIFAVPGAAQALTAGSPSGATPGASTGSSPSDSAPDAATPAEPSSSATP